MEFNPLSAAQRRLALLVLIGFLAFAFWAALQPRLAPPGAYGLDKAVHAGVFAMLAYLGVAASATKRTLVFLALSIAALGAGIEVAQSLVPGREASLSDLAGDLVGVASGLLAARLTLGPIARLLQGQLGSRPFPVAPAPMAASSATGGNLPIAR